MIGMNALYHDVSYAVYRIMLLYAVYKIDGEDFLWEQECSSF